MMSEAIAQGIGLTVAVVVGLAAAFWWGWECRGRLAEKLEYWKVTNRQWHAYDRDLKNSREGHVPLRAQVHDIHERNSER